MICDAVLFMYTVGLGMPNTKKISFEYITQKSPMAIFKLNFFMSRNLIFLLFYMRVRIHPIINSTYYFISIVFAILFYCLKKTCMLVNVVVKLQVLIELKRCIDQNQLSNSIQYDRDIFYQNKMKQNEINSFPMIKFLTFIAF